ncbi:diacylglycerol kinase [Brevibacillus agri]|uniref:Diacylglycerol kinase n=1 Tax=Brevibacillus agri TaxID=51101 RepID=A0A3M8B323_9BACL|nr:MULTISPECIES: diacylglycerol kinase family protein [Brevibacillus]EJL47207.1 diacylglycerol kinase [Brevibacillus sp. CF112]MBY0050301.1 diacylglycerol kinase family protein [Brevibacillus agri]MCG5251096.1 diacylglycerol kinase family protein [Brevibacillus agri]MDN4093298.1 diacylglycerol kinase family protein [Brevibacillus agri]MED1644381.1 diacylglycerol kinase family protein [Brevibacillus agri]
MKEFRRMAKSFGYALQGIGHTVKTQRNMQIHVAAAVIVLAAAWWLHIPRSDVLLVFFSIGLVFSLELANTAVEAVVDLASPDWHEKAKIAKDACAGAVLVAAILSVIIGMAVFGPPLLQKIAG